MDIYAFWNNKGGTGKTSLSFQVICSYANENPTKKILVVDVCPQANLSELFLGGMNQGGSDNLLRIQGEHIRATIGGYFQTRLPSPFNIPSDLSPKSFIKKPIDFNEYIPDNISLLAGDPILELQSNAISTLANTNIPGTNTWISVIDWLKDYIDALNGEFDTIFIDTNPSFSIYTQIALSVAHKMIVPVMADDSSRRALQNVVSLIFGLKLPSEIYAQYAFGKKLQSAGRALPKIHLILKNRITQYMGAASAYYTVLTSIDNDIRALIDIDSNMFTFTDISKGVIEVRDFQTTGVVAHARGCPFYILKAGSLTILGQRVQVKEDYRQNCINNIHKIVESL